MDQKQPPKGQDEAAHAELMAEEIEKLENKIEMYEDLVEWRRKDSNTFNLLGQAYQKLAVLKNDASFNEKAKEAYTKAVNIEPENSLYLADRARFHALTQECDQAVEDFQKLQFLQQQSKGKSLLTDLMVTSTLKELARLDSIKETIHSLRERGALPRDFLDAFDELSNITRRLVVQVAHHTEQINKLNSIVEGILVKIGKGQVTREEVEKLQKEVEQQKREIQRMNDILTLSGVRDKVSLKQKFQVLQTKDAQLFTYAQTFYWTLLNMFGAYKHLNSGLVTAQEGSSDREGLLLEGVKKVVSAGVTVGKALPFVGGVFEYTDNAIDYVVGWFKGKNTENKVAIINKLLRAKFPFDDDISLGVARISLVMIMNPQKIQYIKRIIIPTSPQQGYSNGNGNGHFIRKWYNQLTEYAENVKTTWWPGLKEDEDSFVTSQAVQDVTLLIAYLCVHFSSVLQDQTPLEMQIESILAEDKFDKMLAQIGSAGRCNCGEYFVPREGGAASSCSVCAQKSKGGVKCPGAKCAKKVCINCYQKRN